jgi:putative DNA primase/helicase
MCEQLVQPFWGNPTAKCAKFIEYLERVQPEEAMRKLLQQVCGACLAGHQPENCFIFFHGVGANGKSVLIYILHDMLGQDYAFKAQKQLIFMPDRSERAAASNDKVDLRGKRVITSNETVARNWNMAFIKEFTGGERIQT